MVMRALKRKILMLFIVIMEKLHFRLTSELGYRRLWLSDIALIQANLDGVDENRDNDEGSGI
jgi:hypothetical protein